MEEKAFTRLTLESQDSKSVWEFPFMDPSMEDMCTGFFSALIGQTWLPSTILCGMKEYAESMMEAMEISPKESTENQFAADVLDVIDLSDERTIDFLSNYFGKNLSAWSKLRDKVSAVAYSA